MKKTYEKPAADIEFYALSQSIATCVTKIGLLNSQCVIDDPDSTSEAKTMAKSFGWFNEGACLKAAVDEDLKDGICYHTNANAMFSS